MWPLCRTMLALQLITCSVLLIKAQDILTNSVHDAPVTRDPDVDLSTPDIIRRHGYPAEAHTIQTADGYLLTIHRIPHAAGAEQPQQGSKPVVFLQHGLLGSSADWVLNGPLKALPYLLAEAGYDVWMGNARGNTYSRAHVSLDIDSAEFWNFSFHEIGLMDVPASIDHALTTSSAKQLLYVGHSMGTTMFYALASSRPDYASEKIAAMFSLAPVAYMTHIRSPIRFLAPWAGDIEMLARLLGANELMPQNTFVRFLARYACESTAAEVDICKNFLFAICGFDNEEFDKDLLPMLLGHTPAGTSTKVLVHFAQLIQSGKFCQYDHGSKGNQEAYDQPIPPSYNLSAIDVPVSLHFSDNDLLSNKTDVLVLAAELKTVIGQYEVPLPSFNHLDFIWGKDVKTLVYVNLMEVMKKYTPRQKVIKRRNALDLIRKYWSWK